MKLDNPETASTWELMYSSLYVQPKPAAARCLTPACPIRWRAGQDRHCRAHDLRVI